MSQYLVDRIEQASNIRVRLRTEVVAAHGEDALEAVTLRDCDSDEEQRVAGRSVFIFIGASPNTDWLGDAGGARPPRLHPGRARAAGPGRAAAAGRWSGRR